MPRHRLLPLAAIAAATLALSACGTSGSGTDPYGSVAAPAAGAAPAPAVPEVAATGGPLLAAKDAPGLGTVVTDADGYTLYRFDKDKAKPPTTTCVDACATKWPPVTVDPKGKLTLEGVDKTAIGMVARPDGTSQLTLGGWPVYRFSGDATPGATSGQGVSGTWFAVTPDGKKAAATGGSGTGTGSSGTGAGSTGGTGTGSSGSGASGSGGDTGAGSGTETGGY